MSFVVTANTTFLRGFSCATLPTTSPAVNTAATAIATLRFIRTSPSRRDHVVGLGPEDDAFLDRLHHEMQRDPHDRQHDQHGEDAGDIQGDVELEDEVAEAALSADELAHDGPEHAEHERDVEPREHELQRIGKLHEPERLPPQSLE